MKIKQLFTSFLACMALWSAPVYGDLATDGFFPPNKPLVNFSNITDTKIKEIKNELIEAGKKRRGEAKRKARDAKNDMIDLFSDNQYIDEIKNVKFGVSAGKVHKGIKKLMDILEKIASSRK